MQKPTHRKSKGRALITGASGGIGLELANCFAHGHYDLILVARREDKLRAIQSTLSARCGVDVKVLCADLSEADAPQKIFDECRNMSVEIVVNNAGFGDYGPFADSDLTKNLELLQVNIVALTTLTRLFLPAMQMRCSGKILNVASTASFLPGPLMATYYASKAYVLSFSEALSNELAGSGIGVTCLCPGATKSDFQQNADMGQSKLTDAAMMDAATVARAGYRALMRGQSLMIPGANNVLVANVPRILPRKWTAMFVRSVQQMKS
jgi:short-subunit dehydrogenase